MTCSTEIAELILNDVPQEKQLYFLFTTYRIVKNVVILKDH